MTDVVPQQVRNFLATSTTCVVATTRPDGSVRQSVVYFLFAEVDGTDCIVMSTVAGRAKALDVARTGTMSVCVFGHDAPYPAVTVEGTARVLTVAESSDVGHLTRRIGREIMGFPPELEPTDEQLVEADRVLLVLTPTRCYGASYLPE